MKEECFVPDGLAMMGFEIHDPEMGVQNVEYGPVMKGCCSSGSVMCVS